MHGLDRRFPIRCRHGREFQGADRAEKLAPPDWSSTREGDRQRGGDDSEDGTLNHL